MTNGYMTVTNLLVYTGLCIFPPPQARLTNFSPPLLWLLDSRACLLKPMLTQQLTSCPQIQLPTTTTTTMTNVSDVHAAHATGHSS